MGWDTGGLRSGASLGCAFVGRRALTPPRRFLRACWRGIFRAPARPTFALGGKSGQKRRSNLRFEDPPAFHALCCAGRVPRGWGKVKAARNVELTSFSARCRFCSEMQGAVFYRFGRLSNRALAAIGGKCRCGPLGRDIHRINLVGRGQCAPPRDRAACRGRRPRRPVCRGHYYILRRQRQRG